MLTYTYVKSEFEDKHGAYVPSAWDNRHIANVVLGKTFKHDWEIGLKWRYGYGAPYTPYNVYESTLISNWDINHQGLLDYNKLNVYRTKPFHQLDMRIDKKIYAKKFSLNFYVDIQNLYNFKSELPPIIDVVRDSKGNPVVNPANPSQYQYKYIPNTAGSILPTIGVVFEF